jgi:peptidoglycan/xylan/chitin deacetylase (PgdA/CDA1 family)
MGLRGGYRLRGLTTQALRQPGVTVLLLHYTPPGQLARLMRFVDARREHMVSFQKAMDLVARHEVDRPLIALTFDDGFRSNLAAARALSDRGLGACFYVPTDVVGASQDETDRFFRRPQPEGVMTWAEVEGLVEAGHEVGSHCRQHVPLSGLSPAAAEDQVKGSVEVLRERLGTARHFAWPFGGLKHAPVEEVVRWCAEVDVLPASGVRGRNTPALISRRGYLSRDAVDLNWLGTDYEVFVSRSFSRLGVVSDVT